MAQDLQKPVCFVMLLMLIQLIYAENRTRRGAINAGGIPQLDFDKAVATGIRDYFSTGLCCNPENQNNDLKCADGTIVGELRGSNIAHQ